MEMKPTDFLKRPAEEHSLDDKKERFQPSSKRRATVYDAVAGRVSQWGLIPLQSTNSKTRANQPLRPDEVLFKSSKAPRRYEETDYYFAHANLPNNQRLPGGDLLSALHRYIAKCYTRNGENGNQKVWKCMDETALIALGILMEETAREVLGETGDLAFVEGDEEGLEVDSLGLPEDREVDATGLGEHDKVSHNERDDRVSSSPSSDGDSRGRTEALYSTRYNPVDS